MSRKLNTKRKKYNKYNPTIVQALMDKYRVKHSMITASMLGNRTSKTSLSIIADYNQMEEELKTYLTEKQTKCQTTKKPS